MKIFQADIKLRIALYSFKDPAKTVVSDDNLQFFGECPIELKVDDSLTTYVDGVIDSSRYYVIRVKDPKSSRTTLIGIGFRERDQAFDFKNALNEYIRYIDRSNLANKLSHMNVNNTTNTDSQSSGSKKDGINFDNSQIESYLEDESNRLAHPHSTKNENEVLKLAEHITPLKDGEKIKVKLNLNKSKKGEEDDEGHAHSSGAVGITPPPKKTLGLQPPPPAGSTVFFGATNTASAVATTATASGEDDEWGDFASS